MAPRRNSNNAGSTSTSSSSGGNNNSNNNSGNSSGGYYNSAESSGSSSSKLFAGSQHLNASSNNNNNNNKMPTAAIATTTATPISSGQQQQQQQQSPQLHHHHPNGNHTLEQQQLTRCAQPSGECCKLEALIALGDLSDCVRVLCNNENCNVGQYMHRECFEFWEQAVLVTLRANGRARAWSKQNLWTKKGYDLVYKACNCKCGRGHLRKDLEWTAPPKSSAGGGGSSIANGIVVGNYVNCSGQQQQQPRSILNGNAASILGNDDDDDKKKNKKKRNRNQANQSSATNQNQKPSATALAPHNANAYQSNAQQQQLQPQTMSQQQQQAVQQPQNGSLAPNPNVGVIGSGLPHNNGNGHANASSNGNNLQPSVVATLSNILVNGNSNSNNNNNNTGNVLGLDLRARAGSLSSSGAGSGSTSPSASHSSVDIAISPVHYQPNQQPQQAVQQQQHAALQQVHLQQQQQQQQQQAQQQQQTQNSSSLLLHNWLSKSILNGFDSQLLKQSPAMTSITNFKTLTSFDQQQMVQQQKNKEVELYSERVRSTSGCNGIFSRRLDFSSFNLLPKTRLNSYQVKIEDEGNHGNDETRLFILSSLAQSQMSRVACILCEEQLLVFDRYPLVDGSFFLSPKQHSTGCIEVKYEGRTLYLTCVCMGCLDGTSSQRIISCRFCNEPWDGSNLVLGTMYAYDIFAAMPCCAERFKCNNCFKLLMHPQQRLSFYSDYSHGVTCPYCNTQDTHFVKSLSYCYIKSNAARAQPLA